MARSRLGLFVDGAFRVQDTPDGSVVLCGGELLGFMRFACAVGEHFGRFRLLARRTDVAAAASHPLPTGVEFVPLPHYASLRATTAVARSLPATARAMWRAVADLDVVWVSGVHPLGLLLVLIARLRGRRVVLLIRQNSPAYFRARLPSARWRPMLLPLRLLDLAFRALSTRVPTTVVGAELGRRYGADRPNVLEIRITLVSRSDVAQAPRLADWSQEVRLLTVGRIEPEKNPLLLVQALARLQEAGGDYRLVWAGEGRLADRLLEAATAAGVGDRIELPGFVPFGPGLLGLYRGAHAFVHVALTEGAPQVLYEAMACGLPIVATDVGGVRGALDGGEAGALVPPGDADALAAAVERLRREPALRQRLAARGLELARAATIEDEARRVATFMRA